jgi:hypothetical protein
MINLLPSGTIIQPNSNNMTLLIVALTENNIKRDKSNGGQAPTIIRLAILLILSTTTTNPVIIITRAQRPSTQPISREICIQIGDYHHYPRLLQLNRIPSRLVHRVPVDTITIRRFPGSGSMVILIPRWNLVHVVLRQ